MRAPTDPADQSITIASSRSVMRERDDPGVLVPTREWQRIYKRIRSIREEPQWIKNLGWGLAFLVPATVVAFMEWVPILDQLPASAQLQYGWIGTALVALSIASLLGACLCYVMYRTVGHGVVRDKQHVLDLLDQINERFGLEPPLDEGTLSLIARLRRWLGGD